MITNSNCHSKSNFAAVQLGRVARYGRFCGHLLLAALRRAYEVHMENAQMRLAPVKPRSWRDIPRAGSHHDHW
jgi:hypothetical protein